MALFTNLVLGFGNAETIYFGVLNVLIAVITAFWVKKEKRRRHLGWLALFILVISFIGGGIGAIQTWVFSGFSMEGSNGFVIRFFYENCHWTPFWAQFAAALVCDLADKTITTVGAKSP